MKKMYLVILIFSSLSCKKNITIEPTANEDLIKQAKSYFETELSTKDSFTHATKINGLSPLNDKRSFLWNMADTINYCGKTSVIVPVRYESDFVLTSNLNNDRLYDPNTLTKLLIYPDEKNNLHADQIVVLPDSNYEIGGSFRGVVLIQDWFGNTTKGFQYGDNGIVRELNSYSNNLNRGAVVCIEYSGYNYSIESGDYYYWTVSGGCYYISESPSVKFDGSSGGGGGNGYAPVNNLIISSGDNVIANINEYLKCFDNIPGNDHTYQITLCVAQPNPGTRDPWGFSNGSSSNPIYVGHTYMILSEKTPNKQIVRNIGFYPSTSVWPYQPASSGQLNNDANQTYNISLTIGMTSSEFTNVINFISQLGMQYNLNSNNCVNFCLNALSTAGFNLPRTKANWQGGTGLNPGDLGEDIRQMNLSPNMTRNTVYNNHPNVGDCL